MYRIIGFIVILTLATCIPQNETVAKPTNQPAPVSNMKAESSTAVQKAAENDKQKALVARANQKENPSSSGDVKLNPENSTKWRYEVDTDSMTSKETRFAFITAENSFSFDFPYAGTNYGSLMIRRRSASDLAVMFSVSKGQIICSSSCSVKVRFDSNPPTIFSGSAPTDHSTTNIFLYPASRFVSEVKKAKKTLIQVTYYQAGDQISEFNTSGFKWENEASKKQPEQGSKSKKQTDKHGIFLCIESNGKRKLVAAKEATAECKELDLPVPGGD